MRRSSVGCTYQTIPDSIQEHFLSIDPNGKCPARSIPSLLIFLIASTCVLISHSVQAPLLAIARGDKEEYTFKPQNLIYSCQLVIAIVLVLRFKLSGKTIFSISNRFQPKTIVFLFFIRGLILLVHLAHIYALQFTPVPLLQGLGYTEIIWVILLLHIYNWKFPGENASLTVISIMILTGLYTSDLCDSQSISVTSRMLMFSFGNPLFMGLAQVMTYTVLQTQNIRLLFDNAALLSLIDLLWAFVMNSGNPIPFQGLNTILGWALLATYLAMYLSADFLTISQSPEVFVTLKYFGNMFSVLLSMHFVDNWQRVGLLIVICLTCVNYKVNEKQLNSLKEIENSFENFRLAYHEASKK